MIFPLQRLIALVVLQQGHDGQQQKAGYTRRRQRRVYDDSVVRHTSKPCMPQIGGAILCGAIRTGKNANAWLHDRVFVSPSCGRASACQSVDDEATSRYRDSETHSVVVIEYPQEVFKARPLNSALAKSRRHITGISKHSFDSSLTNRVLETAHVSSLPAGGVQGTI